MDGLFLVFTTAEANFKLSTFAGMIRAIVFFIFGLLYATIGVLILTTKWFLVELNKAQYTSLGILFIVYGLYRMYRAIRSIREKRY